MKKAKIRVPVRAGTWYVVPRVIPGTIVCSKESTAQYGTPIHRRARNGTARHRTEVRCALLSYS